MPVSVPLAEVTRGAWVESVHCGVLAVIDADGKILGSAGDPDQAVFPRSATKPLQCLPWVLDAMERGIDLADEQIAIASGSHTGEASHVETVRGMLRAAAADESALHCGPAWPADKGSRDRLRGEGGRPAPIYHNCSGKHAGMLWAARLAGDPEPRDYWKPDHPVQVRVRETYARLAGTTPDRVEHAVDGCGIPALRVPLSGLGRAFAALGRPPEDGALAAGLERIARAMAAAPAMVAGSGRFDTVLMEATGGRVLAKAGAEGVQAVAVPERGWAAVLKFDDGASRARDPVILAFLEAAGILTGKEPALAAMRRPAVLNSRGETVGEVRATLPDIPAGRL